jgi:hypothetical protein
VHELWCEESCTTCLGLGTKCDTNAYTHIHTRTHARTHARTHTHAPHTHTHARTHIHINTRIHRTCASPSLVLSPCPVTSSMPLTRCSTLASPGFGCPRAGRRPRWVRIWFKCWVLYFKKSAVKEWVFNARIPGFWLSKSWEEAVLGKNLALLSLLLRCFSLLGGSSLFSCSFFSLKCWVL